MSKRRVLYVLMLTFLLCFTLLLGFRIQPVKAATITVPDYYATVQAAINVAASGDTVFVKAGTYYGQVIVNKSISLVGENAATTILDEQDEVGDVVIINASGVLISNFTINGYKRPEPNPPPSYWVSGNGITVEGHNDTFIRNVRLTNGGNAYAMVIEDVHNLTLVDVSVTGNIYGVIIRSCSNITLTDNTITYNWGYSGLGVRSGYGLFLDECYNATLRGNSLQENADDFCIDGQELGHFLHDIDTSNQLLNGAVRKIYYLINQHDATINFTGYPDLGFLALVNSTNMEVQGFDFVDNNPGLLLAYTNNSLIHNNTARYCSRGMWLFHSSHNVISENTFAPNNTDCIILEYFSTNNTISGNGMRDSTASAMKLYNSSRNIIADNNVTRNPRGGIYLQYSDDTILNNNNVTNNSAEGGTGGVRIQYSSNTTMNNNTMNNNNVNFRVVAYYNTQLGHFVHDIDPTNLVDGKHIYYLINYTGATVNPTTYPDAGFVALVNSNSSAIQDLQLQGMLLGYTNNTLVQNNTLANGGDTITMVKSSDNYVTENNATNSSDGISLYDYSKNNTILQNNVTEVGNGIRLSGYCQNNSIADNFLTENSQGIYVSSYCNNTVVTGNVLWNNSGDGIDISTSNFSTITGNNITGTYSDGIRLSGSNCTVNGNNITGSGYDGIRLTSGANNNTVSGNRILDSANAGIDFRNYFGNNNRIIGNDIINSTSYGIQFYILSSNNTVIGNNITDSGIDGIYIYWSSAHLITGNNITNSTRDGIHIVGFFYSEEYLEFTSSHNNITWNNVTLSGRYGIYLDAANNTIHHNRFINNADQTWVDPQDINTWDDGYPSGGNYWSSYSGTDMYSGPLQNIPGGDGIGDTPYIMNTNNTDRYPLLLTLPYTATINAYCITEGSATNVAITKDGTPSGQNTPYSFTDLVGTHTFTVPNTDSSGHPFQQWSTGQTSTTITVSSGGTYTAYYQETAPETYSVTINAYCNTEGTATNVEITMDGSPTGYRTPHTFTDLTGTHTFTVPNTDPMSHPFKQWNTGETTTTITVTGPTTYTAYYEAPPPQPNPSRLVGGRIVSVDPLELLVPRLVSSAPIVIGIVAITIVITIVGTLALRKKKLRHTKD